MDDTTRRVGGDDDEFQGRGKDTVRDYASGTTPTTSTVRSTGATGSTTTGDDDLDPESSRRARQIESEIAHTRAEMSETIEAIQERLRPSNLVSDATDKVKAATTEKVKSMADSASETAQDVMRETKERAYDMVEGAKQNPMPALLIGAGVAWLLFDRSRNKDTGYRGGTAWPQYSQRGGRGYSGGGDYRSSEADYGDVSTTPQSGYSTQYGDSGQYGRGSGSQYGGTAQSAYEGASEAMSDVRDTARQTVRRTQNQLERMLHENPLLVGAAAVLAGAAIGASLPETERENRLMGEARDTVVDRAQEAARDAANTVKEVASDPVAAVSKVADAVSDKKSS
jgi:ElaB/YqjD/DUF883 family membrane-anchored ribosome-binding protein